MAIVQIGSLSWKDLKTVVRNYEDIALEILQSADVHEMTFQTACSWFEQCLNIVQASRATTIWDKLVPTAQADLLRLTERFAAADDFSELSYQQRLRLLCLCRRGIEVLSAEANPELDQILLTLSESQMSRITCVKMN
jgi:hypothetical protein